MATQKIDLAALNELLPLHDNITLAEKFGVTRERIRQLRRLAGVPPVASEKKTRRRSRYSSVTHTEEFQSCLGTLSDIELSKKFNIPMNVVHAARRASGVASHAARRREQTLPFLGKMSDLEVAQKFGYSVSGVVALRRRYNVAPSATDAVKTPRKRRTKAELAAARTALGLPENAKVPKAAKAPTQAYVEPEAAERIAQKQKAKQAVSVDTGTMEFIRRRRAEGDSIEALADRLEMTEDTVRTLING